MCGSYGIFAYIFIVHSTWWDCVKNDMDSLACPKRMRSPGINGEGELKGNRLTQVHLEKWLLKRSVCVCTPLSTAECLSPTSKLKADVEQVVLIFH